MDDILDLEQELASFSEEDIQDFSKNLSYDSFIVLDKKELMNLIRVVDPLTSTTVDNYGKSITFRCKDNTVEGLYYNNPYNVLCRLQNTSGKSVPTFSVSVNILKKLVQNSLTSVIIVFQEESFYISICESLLYVETMQLDETQYPNIKSVQATIPLDKEVSEYAISSLAKALVKTDRVAEKVVSVSDGNLWVSTGVFCAKIQSPFAVDAKFLIYKQVLEVIDALLKSSRITLKYQIIDDSTILLNCDDVILCNLPIGESDRVNEFLTAPTVNTLNFNAGVSVINDSITRIVSLVDALDYLSEVVSIECTDSEIVMTLYSKDMTKSSVYRYPVVEGTFENKQTIRVNSSILITFLSVAGTEAKYQQTENGLGFVNSNGVFLIRRLS